MHRFDQNLRLDLQLSQNKLTVADMKEVARSIAARHTAAEVVETAHRDRIVTRTRELIWENFAALTELREAPALGRLRAWTRAEFHGLASLLWQRFDAGYVRDCHGDLHLANLVRLPTGITTFDCIEFSPDLRHIDVVCDVAFLVMDLVVNGRRDLAAHFLNRYLELTGDYEGVQLLNLYFVYRCLVRAKVAVIRSRERQQERNRMADLSEATHYIDVALHQTARREPLLVIMSGLSGSGKSWVAERLMAALPAIRIRSDLERKRLYRLKASESGAAAINRGIYSEQASVRVYARLHRLAESLLTYGHNVILDAAPLRADDRAAAAAVARKRNCRAVTVAVSAPDTVLRERLLQRQREADCVSDAGLDVLDYQQTTWQPISRSESPGTIMCENTGELDIDALVVQIRNKQPEGARLGQR